MHYVVFHKKMKFKKIYNNTRNGKYANLVASAKLLENHNMFLFLKYQSDIIFVIKYLKVKSPQLT